MERSKKLNEDLENDEKKKTKRWYLIVSSFIAICIIGFAIAGLHDYAGWFHIQNNEIPKLIHHAVSNFHSDNFINHFQVSDHCYMSLRNIAYPEVSCDEPKKPSDLDKENCEMQLILNSYNKEIGRDYQVWSFC